jgi:ABC-type transport system involved in multi-copper enzyme maturation permease subunit
MRLGLGPVFAYEWLTTARRWQVYAARSLFVAALLAGLIVVWWGFVAGQTLATTRALAAVGQAVYAAVVGTQLALVMMAAPAATAGAICLDKARGTLTHLLVTDLSDAEIVLGKLAARLVPVLGLVGCALPVMALSTLLGGIDPVALAGAFLVTLGVAVLGCTLALTFSVWASKTHEVLLATYAVWAVWLLIAPTWWTFSTGPGWLEGIDPFWLALAPSWRSGDVDLGARFAFLAAMLALSAVLAGVAILRLRAVAARQDGRRHRRGRGLRVGRIRKWWPGPTLDGNPVLWREWHRQRPSRWGRIVWRLYAVVSVIFTALSIWEIVRTPPFNSELPLFVVGFEVSIGLLLLSVTAATTLAEERVRGSLDILLATPLSSRSIVWGKWWGTFRSVPALAVLPALIVGAAVVCYHGHWEAPVLLVGLVLAYGAALASLGLALATWIPRLGRAVAATVTIYVAVTVGVFFLFMALWNDETGAGLATASPFMGPVLALVTFIEWPHYGDEMGRFWLSSWTVLYALAAGLLAWAVVATFDRCLGRVSDRQGRPRPARGDRQVGGTPGTGVGDARSRPCRACHPDQTSTRRGEIGE